MTIDQTETHSAHSVTLQKMMAEQVQPDIFDPPHHKLKPSIKSRLDPLLKEFTMLSPNGVTISKVLMKVLNGKNANNKMNRWGLELATYNITFEWISRDKNKAADCLSCLVGLPPTTSALINMLSVSNTDGPFFQYKKPNLTTPYTRYFHSTTIYYT